jgi:tRNA-modifying protein YgfZ
MTAFTPPATRQFDRSGRSRILVEGRSPARMLLGLVTGPIPPDPIAEAVGAEGDAPHAWRSSAPESLVLTPKGRIVSDLRLLRLTGGESGAFLLELPEAGREPLLAHFARYLPPRFARPVDVTATTGMVTVAGPGAVDLGALAGFDGTRVGALAPGEALLRVSAPGVHPAEALRGGSEGEALALVRSTAVLSPAFDLIGTPGAVAAFRARLAEEGVEAGDDAAWQTLRIEHGTPETGRELGEDVLPPEAGLERRAIDHLKGCYTGQEVIVRIRDRGRVNRHLRGLLLGTGPEPTPGTPLLSGDDGRVVGEIRSVARSGRMGQVIGLGFVRREIEPGDRVRVGEIGGPEARVCALTPDGWEVDPKAAMETGDAEGYS